MLIRPSPRLAPGSLSSCASISVRSVLAARIDSGLQATIHEPTGAAPSPPARLASAVVRQLRGHRLGRRTDGRRRYVRTGTRLLDDTRSLVSRALGTDGSSRRAWLDPAVLWRGLRTCSFGLGKGPASCTLRAHLAGLRGLDACRTAAARTFSLAEATGGHLVLGARVARCYRPGSVVHTIHRSRLARSRSLEEPTRTQPAPSRVVSR